MRYILLILLLITALITGCTTQSATPVSSASSPTPMPASLTLGNPNIEQVDKNFIATVEASNMGSQGDFVIGLRVDGILHQTQNVSLNQGENQTITFDPFLAQSGIGPVTVEDLTNKPITKYPADWIVVYEVTGTAKAVSVTYSNSTGGTEQKDYVRLPYYVSWKNFPGSFLYMSAQNQNETGSVTVNIYYKGDIVKTATSTGAYVIATASGSK